MARFRDTSLKISKTCWLEINWYLIVSSYIDSIDVNIEHSLSKKCSAIWNISVIREKNICTSSSKSIAWGKAILQKYCHIPYYIITNWLQSLVNEFDLLLHMLHNAPVISFNGPWHLCTCSLAVDLHSFIENNVVLFLIACICS